MELIKNKKETGCEEEQGSDDCLGAVLCYCSAHGTDKINLHSSLTKTYAGHTHLTVQHRAGFCIRVLSVFTPDEIFLVPPNLLCTPSDKKPPIHIQWYAMLLLTTLWSRHAITTNIWSNSIWWEEAFPTMSECCPSQINKQRMSASMRFNYLSWDTDIFYTIFPFCFTWATSSSLFHFKESSSFGNDCGKFSRQSYRRVQMRSISFSQSWDKGSLSIISFSTM